MIADSSLSRQCAHHLDLPTSPLTCCPHCGGPLALENRPSGPLTDPMIHALIDHLLLVETELAAIRRLLIEEVLP